MEFIVYLIELFSGLLAIVVLAYFLMDFFNWSEQALTPAEESEIRKEHYAKTGDWLL